MYKYILELQYLIINFLDNLIIWSNLFKCYFFEDKILHLAIYNSKTDRYFECYNYDNSLYLFILLILGMRDRLADISLLDFRADEIIICSCVNDGKYHRIITDSPVDLSLTNNTRKNLIFCILDNTHDITHYFNDFLPCIIGNKTMLCKWYVNALSHFYKKDIWMRDHSVLKLMMDDDYNEKEYKENDKLII
jgi:hypothetical protein